MTRPELVGIGAGEQEQINSLSKQIFDKAIGILGAKGKKDRDFLFRYRVFGAVLDSNAVQIKARVDLKRANKVTITLYNSDSTTRLNVFRRRAGNQEIFNCIGFTNSVPLDSFSNAIEQVYSKTVQESPHG